VQAEECLPLAYLEAAEPAANVSEERGLAELAIVHDVDARFRLFAHDVADSAVEDRCPLVVRRALESRDHQLHDVDRPDQAADMTRENAFAAAQQERSSPNDRPGTIARERARNVAAPLLGAPTPEPGFLLLARLPPGAIFYAVAAFRHEHGALVRDDDL